MHLNPSLVPGVNLVWLIQGLANFFIKGQVVNTLGFEGQMVSVTIIQLPLQHKSSYTKYVNEFVQMGVAVFQSNFICKSTR